MNRAAQFAVCCCILATSTYGQQIASVDLSHAKGPTEPTESSWEPGKTALPKGCEKLIPGVIGDGAAVPPNHDPREIVVEIVKLSNENPVRGSEVQGEVHLRNTGKYPIKIPWSTDPNIVEKGQNPNHLEWEEGRIDIELKHRHVLLLSLTQPLFGSRFSAGSELSIQPGEWVTAVIKFKLTPQYAPIEPPVTKGKRDLYVEWNQSANSRSIRNCALATGWFSYRNFYRQQNPTVAINVN